MIDKKFKEALIDRCQNPKGFNISLDGSINTSSFLLVALQEELGEMAGILKRLMRGFNRRDFIKFIEREIKAAKKNGDSSRVEYLESLNPENLPADVKSSTQVEWEENLKKKLADECVDLFSYFILFLANEDIDIENVAIKKFNEVNTQLGLPLYEK